MERYDYERLSASVRILVANPGTIQERLRLAWGVVRGLSADNLPPNQWNDFQNVIVTLSKSPPESLSDEEACRVAGIFYDLDCKVTESWYASIWRSLSH